MNKPLSIIACGLLVLALAAPAFADGQRVKAPRSSYASSICAGGAVVADKTAGFFTNVLHRSFSFFNPCLDLVKGCTNTVLYPVQRSFDYMDDAIACRLPGATRPKAPAPKKP
jgi:hypothetical protein